MHYGRIINDYYENEMTSYERECIETYSFKYRLGYLEAWAKLKHEVIMDCFRLELPESETIAQLRRRLP